MDTNEPLVASAHTLEMARGMRDLTRRSCSPTERGPTRAHGLLDVLLAMLAGLRHGRLS